MDRVEDVRLQILAFFNASPQDYQVGVAKGEEGWGGGKGGSDVPSLLPLLQVVFTKSATGALKLVGETFPWGKDSAFRYLRENHNSVLGIRE